MQTLLEKIYECRKEIQLREAAIAVYKRALMDLEAQRAYCNHVWDAPIRGYEHDGRLCKLCGVNEQYAPLYKKNVESKNI